MTLEFVNWTLKEFGTLANAANDPNTTCCNLVRRRQRRDKLTGPRWWQLQRASDQRLHSSWRDISGGRWGVGCQAYPASMTGWLILNNRVRAVVKTGCEEGISVREHACVVPFIHQYRVKVPFKPVAGSNDYYVITLFSSNLHGRLQNIVSHWPLIQIQAGVMSCWSLCVTVSVNLESLFIVGFSGPSTCCSVTRSRNVLDSKSHRWEMGLPIGSAVFCCDGTQKP